MAHIWRVAVLAFDHMHAGDQVKLALDTPGVELVGAWDSQPARAAEVLASLNVSADLLFTEAEQMLAIGRPDIVVVCSATADHAKWVEYLCHYPVHVVVEKPFATSVSDSARMINEMAGTGRTLSVNWPLAWYPSHRTTKRVIGDGRIGDIVAVHYYDGNTGPLGHLHGKQGTGSADAAMEDKNRTWWYQPSAGGGSLRDYLGYGVTLATWFRDGELPSEVTASWHLPRGLLVDEQSAVIAAYDSGLSTFQTRWGTFTDPWLVQSAPRTGFTVVGTDGAITSWDYSNHITVFSRDAPAGTPLEVDRLAPSERNHLAFLIAKLEAGHAVDGPSSFQISQAGQRIVDTAIESATRKRTTQLLPDPAARLVGPTVNQGTSTPSSVSRV